MKKILSKCKSIIAVSLVVGVMITGFSACGKPKELDNASQVEKTASQAEKTASQAEKAKQKKVEIPLILMGRFTEFLIAMEDGAKSKAKELGVTFSSVDGQSANEVQYNAVNDSIGKGVSAILINPIDSEGIVSAIEAANKSNIPVVTLDAPAAGGKVVAHVGFDNYGAGKMNAEYLVSKMGESGTILEITGPVAAYHAKKRHEGFAEVIAKYPGIKIIQKAADWSADKAYSVTKDVVGSTKITGIYVQNDEMPIGVVSALKELGKLIPAGNKGHIPMVAIDGTPSALDRIRQGIQDATITQDPVKVGEKAMELAYKASQGQQVDQEFDIPAKLLDKSNIDDPALWGNAYAKKTSK